MTQLPPEPLPDLYTAGQQQIVPAHHRPPNIAYDEYGRPHHVVIGQAAPPPVIVNMPERPGMDPALQRLIIVTFLILAVIVVCTASVCAVVVLMGGTLIGIIGAVGQNLTMLTVSLIGIIVAIGWVATKLPSGKKSKKR